MLLVLFLSALFHTVSPLLIHRHTHTHTLLFDVPSMQSHVLAPLHLKMSSIRFYMSQSLNSFRSLTRYHILTYLNLQFLTIPSQFQTSFSILFKSILSYLIVLVFEGCHNKLPQSWLLETTENYFFHSFGSHRYQIKAPTELLPSEGSEGESVPCLLSPTF